jgi:uncharacterized membrane protein YjjB (DUF3815 family)
MMDGDFILILMNDIFWSAVAAFGFAILFKVPRRSLPMCILAGALGHGVRTVLVELNVVLVLASFAGATVVGFFGYWLSRRFNIPSTVFTVPGVIPLVPGSIAFETMVILIRTLEAGQVAAGPLFVAAALNALTAALIILGLGLGISSPFLLFRRQKPVV